METLEQGGPPDDKLQAIFNGLSQKNPGLQQAGFDAFKRDMSDDNNLKRLYEGLSKKNQQLVGLGFEAFKADLYGNSVTPAKTEQVESPFPQATIEQGTSTGPAPLKTEEQVKKKDIGSVPSPTGSSDTSPVPKTSLPEVSESMSFWDKAKVTWAEMKEANSQAVDPEAEKVASPFINAVRRGLNSADQAGIINPFSGNPDEKQIKQLVDIQKRIADLPASKSYNEFNQSKSLGGALSALAKNPAQIIAELTGESMSALASYGAVRMGTGAATGAAIGSVVPGIGTSIGASEGFIVGMADASLGLEYSSKFVESLQEQGVDMSSVESLKKAFSDDAIISEARKVALQKGIPIAIFDLISGGIAGKIVSKPAKSILTKVAYGAGEFGVQASLGGAGELAGELSSGEEINPSAIIAEMIGELGTTPIEVSAKLIGFSNKMKNSNSKATPTNETVQPEQQAVPEPASEDAGRYDFSQSKVQPAAAVEPAIQTAEPAQKVNEDAVPTSVERNETSTGPDSGSVTFGARAAKEPVPVPVTATPEQVEDLNKQEEHWRQVNDKVSSEVDQKTRVIARHLQKFPPESWKRFGDPNFMSDMPAARLYMNRKKGTSLDVQAQNMSNIFNPYGDGNEITPQDIVDFVQKYPNPKFQLTLSKDAPLGDTKLSASQLVDASPDLVKNQSLAKALQSMEATGITPENLNDPEIMRLLDNDFLFSVEDRKTIRDIFEYAKTEEGAKKINSLRDGIRAEVSGVFEGGPGIQEVPGGSPATIDDGDGDYEIVENELGFPAFWSDPDPNAQPEYVRTTNEPQVASSPSENVQGTVLPGEPGSPPAVNGSTPSTENNVGDTREVQPVPERSSSRVEEARQKVKDRIASVKEKYDALYNDQTLGAISDPKKRAQQHYDLHRELVALATDLFDVGIATVEEFASVIGRDVDAFLKRVWTDAEKQKNGQPVEVTNAEFFEEPSQRISGIKKALVPQEVLNDVDIEKRSTQQMLDRAKRLVDNGEINPEAIVNEIANGKARALQPDEVAALVYYKSKLDAQSDKTNANLLDAIALQDLEAITRLRGEYNFISEKLLNYHEMSAKTAYEQSLAFRLRQMLLNGEYELATQVRKYKAVNGGTMPPDIEDKFRKLDDDLKKANARIQEIEQRQKEEIEREVVERIQKQVDREQTRPGAPRRGKQLMAEGFDDLAQALGITQMAYGERKPSVVLALEKIGRGLIDEGLASMKDVSQKVREYVKDRFGDKFNYDDYESAFMDSMKENVTVPEVKKNGKISIPQDYLKGLVASGITDINDLVDRVHSFLIADHPDITKRQVRDAITSYGKTIALSQDEIDVKLRTMKRIGKMLSSLEDISRKKRPLRSGLQRDNVSEKERQMMKEIREGMKDLPQSEEESEKAWRTALDNVKRRLENRISDLEEQIRTGAKTAKPKGIEYDAEALALRERVNALRDIIEGMEGKRSMSEEQRVKLAINAAERSIKEYERRISQKDFSPNKKPGVTLTPELVKARAQRDELKIQLKNMMDEAGIADQRRLQGYKTRLRSSITELEQRIKNKDFEKVKKKETKLDREAQDLLTERERIKHEFDVEQEKVRMKNRSTSEKWKDAALDIWNLPKSMLSSMDLSAPLRQGAILTFAHPVSGSKALVGMFQFLASQKRYDQWFNKLKTLDIYPTIRDSKLYLSEPSAKLTAREESFMSSLATRIPVLGPMIKGSERAYTGYLNVLRLDVFTNGVDQLRNMGITPESNPEAIKALASFINNATGRGNLGALESSAGVLNGFMFSPRYLASRVNLLNPATYARMPKEVRKMVLRDMVTYVGFGLTILALAGVAGADVDYDPRSTDFGKIKIGDTRYDIWAGFQPIIRVIAQAIITGQKKSPITGEIQDLDNPGFNGATRASVIGRFARTKLSPGAGSLYNFLDGKDFLGNEVTVQGELVKNVFPLYVQDMYEIYQTEGAAGLSKTAIPSAFGIGVQNYKVEPEDSSESEQVVEEEFAEEEF